jgi:hypothetical protein
MNAPVSAETEPLRKLRCRVLLCACTGAALVQNTIMIARMPVHTYRLNMAPPRFTSSPDSTLVPLPT